MLLLLSFMLLCYWAVSAVAAVYIVANVVVGDAGAVYADAAWAAAVSLKNARRFLLFPSKNQAFLKVVQFSLFMHFLAKGFSNINRLLFCFSRLVASLLIFASTYIARESYTVHTFVSPCTYRHMFVEFVFIDSGSDPIIDKALCVLSITVCVTFFYQLLSPIYLLLSIAGSLQGYPHHPVCQENQGPQEAGPRASAQRRFRI